MPTGIRNITEKDRTLDEVFAVMDEVYNAFVHNKKYNDSVQAIKDYDAVIFNKLKAMYGCDAANMPTKEIKHIR